MIKNYNIKLSAVLIRLPDYLCKTLVDVATVDFGTCDNGKIEIWTLNKRWNWNSCVNVALSGRRTHDPIAQLARTSERNLVIVDLNPTQTNFFRYFSKLCCSEYQISNIYTHKTCVPIYVLYITWNSNVLI